MCGNRRTGRGRSVEPPGAERERLIATGMRIADFYDVPPETVRHAQFQERVGESWVMRQCWERLIDGQWNPEPEFPGWLEMV